MRLEQFIKEADSLRALGILVSQGGAIIGEHRFEAAIRRNVYSASKSFTAAAVGIAQGEGLLSMDERLTDVFPEDLPDRICAQLEKATVRDLLTMSLGQERPLLMAAERPFYTEKDWVKLSLAQPFAHMPREEFMYSNVGPYLAGVLVQRRAGCDLVHYLQPRLFAPLGISMPTWETDPLGNTFGAGGLFLNMYELHKLGLLYLQKGIYGGKQLVPAEWVAECCKKQAETGEYGYGYLFWGGPGGTWRADGMHGQYSIVCREKNAVITVVAESRREKELLDLIFAEVYTQI